MRLFQCVTYGVFALGLLRATPALADDSLLKVKPFLVKHCIQCHGPKKQEGDYRFDTLKTNLRDVKTLETWQNILDQLNLGEMPPPKKPQPTLAESRSVILSLTEVLKKAYAKKRSTGGKTVIRRLNRYELRNTLRDLLYLQGAAYQPGAVTKLVDNNGNGIVERKGSDPVRAFPEDEEKDGFTNIGGKLVMSDFLLKLTLAAAEETLEAATHLEKRPDIKTRRFAGHIVTGRQYGQQTLETVSREFNPDYDLLVQRYQRFGRLSPHALRGGVGTSARYRITVEASAHNLKHPWRELIKIDQNAPMQLSLNIADTKNGGLAGPTSKSLVLWSLKADGKKRSFSFETWLDKSWTPWIGWENGPYDRAFRAELLAKKYLPDVYKPRPDKKVNKKAHDTWPVDLAREIIKKGYKGPHIRIYSLAVEPLIDAWPPKSHTALYGTGPPEKANVEKLFLAFAQRAYRRPVSAEEVAPYVQLVRNLMKKSATPSASVIKDLTFKAYKGKWEKLPQFSKLKPYNKGALTNGLIDIRPAKRKEQFGMVFEGKLATPETGDYQFQLASDDGARLIIDGKTVVNHDGLHGASTKIGNTRLKVGEHSIRVEYFAYGQPNSFFASWSGPGFSKAPLAVNLKTLKQNEAKNSSRARAIKALQAGYTAMLCSPKFLYIKEKGDRLTHYEIASRLSYFLWSSMPDERLMELAKAGKLSNNSVLDHEVERMLKDPKAVAFTRNFTTAWLRLDKLGKMPPERSGPFRFYHDRKMEPMLISQTVAYFADLVESNGKVEKFINSDYTFMNETIANWIYGRKDVHGARLQKVKLNDPRRGGIFTQPSVMTATSNGVDTSPVVRGVWVLENVLGTPPSPPPPDVEPLAPDLRGAQTIREQLQLHRKIPSCNSCHRKIDPMGFAMENFDPVGRWRDMYRDPRKKIDASATLANGKKIANIVAFKKMLMERKDHVTRCLTKKLLTYASGRILESSDRGEVDRIVNTMKKKKGGVRDLIKYVVKSEIFLSK